jgi:hypothetical protein
MATIGSAASRIWWCLVVVAGASSFGALYYAGSPLAYSQSLSASDVDRAAAATAEAVRKFREESYSEEQCRRTLKFYTESMCGLADISRNNSEYTLGARRFYSAHCAGLRTVTLDVCNQ